MTSPTAGEIYRTSSKQVLVTRDPVFTHPYIYEGRYIGIKPHNYLPLSIIVTILNPLIGPAALLMSFMSDRAYSRGDLRYAQKWSQYAFLLGIVTIIASVVLYIAIGFALSPIGIKGGHTY